MLSAKEKQKLLQEHWDPDKTVDSFVWAVLRWCEEYKSVREGVIALSDATLRLTNRDVPVNTLLKYAYGTYPDPNPDLVTVIPVLHTILREEKR